MIDQIKAALGMPTAGSVAAEPGTHLYAPDPLLWQQEPGSTRNRIDLSNTTLTGSNPIGSAQIPRRLFRHLRVSSYFNGTFVLSITRLPTPDEVAQAAAGVANDPSGFDAVFRAGDQRVLDFGDVAERSLFIQCQLIGGGLALPAGAIVIESDTEKFEARVDNTGIAIAPPTVPVPPLSPITAAKAIQVVPVGTTNIAIPIGATGFLLVLYGAGIAARAKGTVSILGDVSNTEYVPSAQQNFFAATTILTGITPTDANIAITLSGPYTCQLFWLGLVTVAGTVNIGNTASVTIASGTVDIGNTPSVTISGTPTVIASGTINIGNTPSVTISGTPTVILGGGTASIGSVSAINSTVTVAGTINIGNTPSVSISGTPNVNIASGTVNIGNTPNITIVGQTINLNTQQPQTSLGSFTVPGPNGANNAIYNVPAGTHAIGITVDAGGLSALTVKGVTSGINYLNLTGNGVSATPLQGYFVSPVLSVIDTQVQILGSTNATWAAGPTVIRAVAILDAEGVFIFDNSQEPAGVQLISSGGLPIAVSSLAGGQVGALNVGIPLEKSSGVGQQGTYTTSVVTLPGTNGTAVQLAAANANRRGLFVFAAPTSGVVAIAEHGLTNMLNMPVGAYWEMPSPVSTRQIDAVTQNTAGGAVVVTEIT